MVLPVLAAIAVGLVWAVSLAATQVRVVDAAREVARAVARGEDEGTAVALGRRVAPEAARVTVGDEGDLVTADVAAGVRGPGGLLRFLPEVRVHASAVALKEPG